MGDITRPRRVGEALRLLRQRANVSRDELADRSGVSAGTLSNYESGRTRNPRSQELWSIVTTLADILGEKPEDLFAELMAIARTKTLRAEEDVRRPPDEGR